MSRTTDRSPPELDELRHLLSSRRNLQDVFTQAFPIFSKIIPADSGALCVSKSGLPSDYRFTAVGVRNPDWFGKYHEIAADDFVSRAVNPRPNQVLCDQDMVSRREKERSRLYRRARDLGMPLEHVMAVKLDAGSRWHAGVLLYRRDRRPFAEQERGHLHALRGDFLDAIRSHLLDETLAVESVLEETLDDTGIPLVVMSSAGVEVSRFRAANDVIERWAAAGAHSRSGLPLALLEYFRNIVRAWKPGQESPDWVSGDGLRVSFARERGGADLWRLLFHETSTEGRPPAKWGDLLTDAELAVVAGVLRGLSNQEIAQDRGVVLQTIKAQLQSAYRKLGVKNRLQLFRAAELEKARSGERAR